MTVVPATPEHDTGTAHLQKVLRWWDGVTINMAMPAALFVSLGFSIVALGAWGAIVLWGIAAVLATNCRTAGRNCARSALASAVLLRCSPTAAPTGC